MTRRPGHLQRSCLLMQDLVLLCLVWLVPLSFVQGRAWDGNQSARRLVTIRMVQRLPGKPSSADRQAKMLTSQIAKATSVQKLVSILDEVVDGPIFNSIHASAAYKRLEAFKKRGGLRQIDWDDQVLLRLHARVVDMALKGVLEQMFSGALGICLSSLALRPSSWLHWWSPCLPRLRSEA